MSITVMATKLLHRPPCPPSVHHTCRAPPPTAAPSDRPPHPPSSSTSCHADHRAHARSISACGPTPAPPPSSRWPVHGESHISPMRYTPSPPQCHPFPLVSPPHRPLPRHQCDLWQCDFPWTPKIRILFYAIELRNDYSIDVLVCINMFSSKYLIVQKTYCRTVQKTYLMHIAYSMHCTDI
jgi:hypothetical protein